MNSIKVNKNESVSWGGSAQFISGKPSGFDCEDSYEEDLKLGCGRWPYIFQLVLSIVFCLG